MADSTFLDELEALIQDRLTEAPDGSYTASLGRKGVLTIAQKVGEEGVELALAGAAQDDARVVDETADLLFHVLVLLQVRGIALAEVIANLEERHRSRESR